MMKGEREAVDYLVDIIGSEVELEDFPIKRGYIEQSSAESVRESVRSRFLEKYQVIVRKKNFDDIGLFEGANYVLEVTRFNGSLDEIHLSDLGTGMVREDSSFVGASQDA